MWTRPGQQPYIYSQETLSLPVKEGWPFTFLISELGTYACMHAHTHTLMHTHREVSLIHITSHPTQLQKCNSIYIYMYILYTLQISLFMTFSFSFDTQERKTTSYQIQIYDSFSLFHWFSDCVVKDFHLQSK